MNEMEHDFVTDGFGGKHFGIRWLLFSLSLSLSWQAKCSSNQNRYQHQRCLRLKWFDIKDQSAIAEFKRAGCATNSMNYLIKNVCSTISFLQPLNLFINISRLLFSGWFLPWLLDQPATDYFGSFGYFSRFLLFFFFSFYGVCVSFVNEEKKNFCMSIQFFFYRMKTMRGTSILSIPTHDS